MPVEGCQLVTPRGVAIGVCRGDAGAADRILRGCEGIRRLAQNVPALIIRENPCRSVLCIGGICGRNIWIIHPNQLPDGVILVAGGLRAVADAGDVSVVIVSVSQRDTILRDSFDQPGGAVGAGQGDLLMVGMGSPAFLACCGFI